MTHNHSDKPDQPPHCNGCHGGPEIQDDTATHSAGNVRGTDRPPAAVHHGPGGLGPDPSVREVARAAWNAWLSPDLLRSGPVLWPFGRRARARRARNQAVTAEAHRRRDDLRATFDTLFTSTNDGNGDDVGGGLGRRPDGRRPVSRRARAGVILALAGMVVTIAVAGWTLSSPASRSTSSPTSLPAVSPPPADTGSSATELAETTAVSGATLPARPPIPSGGVEPTSPHPAGAVDPGAVRVVEPPRGDPTPAELATPEGAMRAWLARWCPFDHGEQFGAAQRRARPAMTDAGWSILNPYDGDARDAQARASWDKTQAAGESGRCSEPTALVSPAAPRAPDSAIVIGALTRLVTAPGQPAYTEPLSVVWRVRRGADGLWRLDLPTEGG
jgi:hypothetical protein